MEIGWTVQQETSHVPFLFVDGVQRRQQAVQNAQSARLGCLFIPWRVSISLFMVSAVPRGNYNTSSTPRGIATLTPV